MKDIKLYYGRQSPMSDTPTIREMLDTVYIDMPEYEIFQVIDNEVFTLAGTYHIRYLIMYKNL